jgi:hypothetical protein
VTLDPNMTNTISLLITAAHMAALGQIEGGADDIDRAGRAGEITRYQILPAELHFHGYGTADVESLKCATIVCRRIWQARVNVFIAEHAALPTPEQLYLLWHRPARVFHPRPRELERAGRFANLAAKLGGAK